MKQYTVLGALRRRAQWVAGAIGLLSGCSRTVVGGRMDGAMRDIPTSERDASMANVDTGVFVGDSASDSIDVPNVDSIAPVDAPGPPAPTPRPIFPVSLGDVSLRRPTLRWQLPVGTDGAEVSLCRDRACTLLIETVRIVGTSMRPSVALPPRSVVFWRLRATVGAATNITYSPTWLFHVPATDNSSNIDTSSNPHFDLNGDGFDDIVVGASTSSPRAQIQAGTVSVFHGSAAGVLQTVARVLEGVAANDLFGCSVAHAGDVNGDGFGDLIVGAYQAAPGGRLDAGAASVFHGSEGGISVSPSQVLEGAVASDLFGSSVAGAGDVNGDGFSDIVVGAFNASPGGRGNAGTASVFHGSATGVLRDPAIVLEGVSANERFGFSVAGAGDLNGDRLSDLVVGAYQAAPGGRRDAGRASVFQGSAMGIQMSPTQVLDGVAATDQFGFSVASAGDLNGDGFGDLIVGAIQTDPGGRGNTGRASVFHGSAMGVSRIAMRVLEGVAPGGLFGFSVSSARDLNGDGFGDLVVGAQAAASGGRSFAGTASVFYGAAMGVPMTPTRVIEGVRANDRLGYSVAGAGDVNGDGFADIVVGAFTASPGGRRDAGAASVFQGTAMGIPVTPAWIFEGRVAGDNFGCSVASSERAHRSVVWRVFALS